MPGSGPQEPQPAASSDAPAGASDYAGKDLDRPRTGPGSLPGLGRRFASLMIDWVLCLIIARAIFGSSAMHAPGSLWTSVIIGAENILLVGTAGATLGQRLLRIRVETVDGQHPGLLRGAIRGVLLALAVPALSVLWQRDQRGLHELTSGTVAARW